MNYLSSILFIPIWIISTCFRSASRFRNDYLYIYFKKI